MARDPHAFAKATGRDKYWKKQESELLDLIDPATGELKKGLSRQTDCAACGSNQNNLAFMKEGFRFVKCCQCGLLFVNPQLDESKLIDSYTEGESQNDWVNVLLTPEQIKYDSKERFGKAIQWLEKRYGKKGRGRLLDVGCSVGLFMNLMQKKGWDPLGMEINKVAVKHAREEFGLEVLEKLLHEVELPKEGFQVISMWGVLEHIAKPGEVLDQIHPLLDKKGTLVLLVPNGHSLATRIMHSTSPTFGGRNHLWYHTPKTLTRMLKRHGFKMVDMYTQLNQIEELQHFLSYNNPYLPDKKVEFEEFQIKGALRKQLETHMEKNLLGYKLIGFAQKI